MIPACCPHLNLFDSFRMLCIMTPTSSAHLELRKTLDDSLLVKHISTRMEICEGDRQAVEIRAYMEKRNFDVMGLSSGGGISLVCGTNPSQRPGEVRRARATD